MKMLFPLYLILLSICAACNSDNNSDAKKTILVCDSTYYSKAIDSLIYAFKPSTLDLGESLTPDIKTFIENSDSSCLVENPKYELFIVSILIKLAILHQQEAKQGFDLNYMGSKHANFFIEGFRKLSNDKHSLEFFNSLSVIGYAEENQKLKSHPYIKDLLTQYEVVFSKRKYHH